jgi:hypothetical protein
VRLDRVQHRQVEGLALAQFLLGQHLLVDLRLQQSPLAQEM